MALQELEYRQNEFRQLVGKAVFRLNAQGKEISRRSIMQTLHDFINETDNKERTRMLKECIDILIITNGNFLDTPRGR